VNEKGQKSSFTVKTGAVNMETDGAHKIPEEFETKISVIDMVVFNGK
jgi:hypothetical protein